MALDVTFDTKLFETMLREHPKLTEIGLRRGFNFYRHDFERAWRRDRLSGQSGHSLGRRTGQLARAWTSAQLGKPETLDGMGVVFLLGTKYARAHMAPPLGTAPTKITPKRGKYLSIPVGSALKPSGVAKESSPRNDGRLRLVIRKGRPPLLVRDVWSKGKKVSNFLRTEIRWVLVRSVTIPARLNLYKDIQQSMPSLVKLLNKTLGAIYGKWK